MGTDNRIGPSFLFPGVGTSQFMFSQGCRRAGLYGEQIWGGPRHPPRDNAVNRRQKKVMFHKAVRQLGEDDAGKTVAMWGLAFKPNTDDIREAPALTLIERVRGCWGSDPT